MNKSKAIRFWFPLMAAVALLLVIAWWGRSRYVHWRWRSADQRVQQMAAALLVERAPRPVLLGAASPGNAFDDYERAWRESERAKPDTADDPPELNGLLDEGGNLLVAGSPRLPMAKLRRALARFAQFHAALKAGAQRSRSQWHRKNTDFAWLEKVYVLESFDSLGWRVRDEWAAGQKAEAVTWLLVALQYVTDLMESGEPILFMFGAEYQDRVAAWQFGRPAKDGEPAMAPILDLGDLPALELARVDRGLVQLDRLPRSTETWQPSSLVYLHSVSDLDVSSDEWFWSWRHGFSHLAVYADAIELCDQRSEQLAAVEGDWPTRRRDFLAIRSDGALRRNYVATDFLQVSHVRTFAEGLRALARLRALRIVVQRAKGQATALQDPFGATGTMLRVTTLYGKLCVQSVGDSSIDGPLVIQQRMP